MSNRLKRWFSRDHEDDDEFDETDEFDEEIEEPKDEPTTEEIEAAKVILSAVEPEAETAEEEFTIPKPSLAHKETFPDDMCFICRRVGLEGGRLNMLASSGHVVMFICNECAERFKRG